MNLVGWLAGAARDRPGGAALYRGTGAWASWEALARQATGFAAALRGPLGLAPGDRVALVMANAPEYLVALYGTWWAGLAAVPVNAKLHPREVAFILGHSGARLAVHDAGWAAGLAEAAREVPGLATCETGGADWRRFVSLPGGEPAVAAPADLAWLFYTSGTTGRPKGAMLSHANLAAMVSAYAASVDTVLPHGRLLHAAPMSHGSGLYTLTHLAAGAAQVVPESGGFDADETLALLEGHTAVSMFAAPTMVKRLAQAAARSGARAAGLQTLVYGGGPMYLADLREATAALGPRLAQIYGQGESPMTITSLTKAQHATEGEARLASVGTAQAGVAIALRDPEGREVPAGEVGEICVRGPTVMAGYWNDPAATAKALSGGWLHTGDLGVLDAGGFLTLRDRSKDLIISGGSNIYPREVEEVLLAHPAVGEAAVVGRPDAEWGEAVVAFIVARGAAPDAAELDRHCLAHIARFKRPKEYRFVASLPKNHYGKVLKTELRASLG